MISSIKEVHIDRTRDSPNTKSQEENRKSIQLMTSITLYRNLIGALMIPCMACFVAIMRFKLICKHI